MEQLVARQVHYLKVVGSSPASASNRNSIALGCLNGSVFREMMRKDIHPLSLRLGEKSVSYHEKETAL